MTERIAPLASIEAILLAKARGIAAGPIRSEATGYRFRANVPSAMLHPRDWSLAR